MKKRIELFQKKDAIMTAEAENLVMKGKDEL